MVQFALLLVGSCDFSTLTQRIFTLDLFSCGFQGISIVSIINTDIYVTLICCFSLGDDFELIQQEIAMMQNCQHPNIIKYIGSYIRYMCVTSC